MLTLKCPECRIKMIQLDHHGVTLDRCPGCDGLWFDIEEIHRYLKAHPATPHHGVPEDYEFTKCTRGLGEDCPCCGEKSFELGGFRGVVFQRCTWCGGIFIASDKLRELIKRASAGDEHVGAGEGVVVGVGAGEGVAVGVFELLLTVAEILGE
jgi:Zn-finger nucleic acid-binding protein